MPKRADNHLNVFVLDRGGKAVAGAKVRFFDGVEELGASTIAGDNQPAQIDLPPAYSALRVVAEVRGCKSQEATVDMLQRNFEFRFDVPVASANAVEKTGTWSRADILTLVGIVVAIIGGVAAWLAVPGIPKLFHWDTEKPASTAPAESKPSTPANPIQKVRDTTSGQVNLGCDQTLTAETPPVLFGRNPRNIDARPAWINTNNVKSQNQSVTNIEDADHHVTGMKAAGVITGLDSQNILGVKNCPGGGHGELTLRVSWTEDQ